VLRLKRDRFFHCHQTEDLQNRMTVKSDLSIP
jgi:hypothetical protein